MFESDPHPRSGTSESPRPEHDARVNQTIVRVLVKGLQIIGTVIAGLGVIAFKVMAKNNGEIWIVVALIGIGIFLVVGAAKLLQVLIADARRECPSPGIGGLKLAVGGLLSLLAYHGFSTTKYEFGLMQSAPYGWENTLPHTIVIGLGMSGVVIGLLAFVGRRPNRRVLASLVVLVAVGLGCG